jgi:ubiquinone/menaquinone biosynthesis C-methylase UbiE
VSDINTLFIKDVIYYMNKKETKENVKSQFGKNAKNYVTSKWHSKGKDLAKLIDIAELKGGEYGLDIAIGGGHTANAIAPMVKKVVALDLTDEILNVARKFIEENGFNNVDFIQGDAEQLPFPDETFDIITCRIAAHHFFIFCQRNI